MKKILLLALPLMVMCFASCNKEEEWTDDSPIIQFKDPKFLIAAVNNFYTSDDGRMIVIDINRDEQISEKEASITKRLYAGNYGIRNLEEIKYFTAVELLFCQYNELTSLNVSNNTALAYLDCYSNQFTSLDVSNNTALTYLNCTGNQLTSLDLSKNTALTELGCSGNELTTLDVSNNTALTGLNCENNQLTELDLSRNTALTYLNCTGNQLTSLDLSKNTALTELDCRYNKLTRLILYRYHLLSNTVLNQITKEYGDIIEYVE